MNFFLCFSFFSADDDPVLEGVIPRSVKDIFEKISDSQETEFIVKVSFMELYNEQLFDLLSTKPRREDTIVDIREDGNKGIKIPGLTENPIMTVEETMTMLEKASEGRVTAATAMNARSSRSHAIFTLSIEAKPKADPKAMTISKFHLVNLAGSAVNDRRRVWAMLSVHWGRRTEPLVATSRTGIVN